MIGLLEQVQNYVEVSEVNGEDQGVPSICLDDLPPQGGHLVGVLASVIHIVKDLDQHLIFWQVLDLVHLVICLYLMSNVLEKKLVIKVFVNFHEIGDVSISNALDQFFRIVWLNQLVVLLFCLSQFYNVSQSLVLNLLFLFKLFIE